MSFSMCKAFSFNAKDELYTPKVLVEVLDHVWLDWELRFMDDKAKALGYPGLTEYYRSVGDTVGLKPVVWCPFDWQSSEFVWFFGNRGAPVVASHISEGKDFFKWEPDRWDIAVSNPPFSRKLDVFKRLDSLGKPWAMLSNVMCINYQEIGNYFADHGAQMLVPDKRVSFDGNPSSFCSGYFCRDFMRSDLKFVHVPHNNVGKNFEKSRMYDRLDYAPED